MTLMTDADDDRKDKARVEWQKFEDVSEFLVQVAQFDRKYKDLKESGMLTVIGSLGDGTPKHDLPPGLSEQTWNSLSLQDQFNELCLMAQSTDPYVNDLFRALQEGSEIDARLGRAGISQSIRVKKRRTCDKSDDIRHVMDLSRCMIIEVQRLGQVRSIIHSMSVGALSAIWEIVQIQDGFEESEAFGTGGYRDIRVHARCRHTGYVIRMEFHLRCFRELRDSLRAIDHPFTNSKWQFLAITDASQVLDMSLLSEMVDAGLEALNDVPEHHDSEKAKILTNLGELLLLQLQKLGFDDRSLQKATLASKAVYYFDQALRIIEKKPVGGTVVEIHCRVLIGLSQALCNYDWSIYCAARYHEDVAKRVELAPILYPEMNSDETRYGIERGISKCIIEGLAEGHPVTLRAKYVKADAMVGREGIDYCSELIREQRSVLGYDHPMVFDTLICRYTKIPVEETVDALNDIVEILQVNLDRLGIDHPSVTRLLLALCAGFQSERESFLLDAPGNQVSELLRILSQCSSTCVDLLQYALSKTVHSPDASKLQVNSRVAVWSWEHQDYWSGIITEMKDKVIRVEYDLPGNAEWISPLRRHTLLLSDGSHEPTPLPQSSTMDEVLKVGDRMLLWYGFSDNSFYSATIESKDKTQIKVVYDTNEHQFLQLKDMDGGSVRYFVTTRKDSGKAKSVKDGDRIYVYWDVHKTYWLGKVLGVADEEENKDQPSKFCIQFYSGDLHVCDLSKMNFYPESHPLF